MKLIASEHLPRLAGNGIGLLFYLASLACMPAIGQTTNPASKIELSGIAKYADRAALTFGSAGRIVELNAQEGQTVARGELLARLDDQAARAALIEAKEIARSTAAIAAAQAELSASEARLAAMENANSRQSLAYSAQAIVDARAVVTRDRKLVQQRQDERRSAQKAVETAEARLQLLHLRAPFDGAIVEKLKTIGEGVDPVEPVYQLVSDHRIQVEFFIPQSLIPHFAKGTMIEIVPSKGVSGDPAAVAKIGFVDLSIQPIRHVVRAWAQFERPPWLLDGMQVAVRPIEPASPQGR